MNERPPFRRMNRREMHDEACYHMLRLKHSAKLSNDDLEREYDVLCATTWSCDPFGCDERLGDDIRRIQQFCNATVRVEGGVIRQVEQR